MSKVYHLTRKHKPKIAMAIALKRTQVDHYDLIKSFDGKSTVRFAFELHKMSETRTGVTESKDLSGLSEIWLDYQACDWNLPMMSEKLKDLVDEHLTGDEGVDWLKCKVHGGDETRTYYVLRFAKKLRVLDREKTRYVPGTNHVILPAFSLSKVSKYAIFHSELSHNFWKITGSLYIGEALKKAMQRSKITGVAFEKARVV
jgi:hypothetical protein